MTDGHVGIEIGLVPAQPGAAAEVDIFVVGEEVLVEEPDPVENLTPDHQGASGQRVDPDRGGELPDPSVVEGVTAPSQGAENPAAGGPDPPGIVVVDDQGGDQSGPGVLPQEAPELGQTALAEDHVVVEEEEEIRSPPPGLPDAEVHPSSVA